MACVAPYACQGLEKGGLTCTAHYAAPSGQHLGMIVPVDTVEQDLCSMVTSMYGIHPQSLLVVPCARKLPGRARSAVFSEGTTTMGHKYLERMDSTRGIECV